LWYAPILRWALAKVQKNALLFRKNATDAARSRKQTQKKTMIDGLTGIRYHKSLPGVKIMSNNIAGKVVVITPAAEHLV
jgi:hypothetical protein